MRRESERTSFGHGDTNGEKPEEVLIEQDERGEIVRQATKDTDAIAVYVVFFVFSNTNTLENVNALEHHHHTDTKRS